jgi:hypothetical protein
MEDLLLFNQKFIIKNNKLTVEDINNNYKFTNDLVEIFQFIVSHNYDDYYLERVYLYILKLKGSEYLLNGCNNNLRYTEKICTIIENCCKNPGGELEYQVLKLLTIDITYIDYIKKLDQLVFKFLMMDKLLNNEYTKSVSGKSYYYNFFNIDFDKIDFEFSIICDSSEKYKLAMSKLNYINKLDFSEYYLDNYNEIDRKVIIFKKQSYEIFDDLIKYLENII